MAASKRGSFVLYNNIICPFGARAWLAILLKKVDFEAKWVSLQDKEDFFKEAYAKAHFHDETNAGKVPILGHDDELLSESLIIARYLDDVVPDVTPLFPRKNPLQKAAVEAMISFFEPAIGLFYGILFSKDEKDRAEKCEKFSKLLNAVDKRLSEFSKSGFFLGDNISLFEVMAFPFFDRFVVNENLGLGPKVADIMKENPRIKSWYDKVSSLEEVKKMHAEILKQSGKKTIGEYFTDHYKTYREKRS